MIRGGQFAQVLLTFTCCVLCLLLVQNRKPQIMITVRSDTPIDQMGRIIQLQRERIKYLSSHPRVIYRCPDDQPSIQYPRYASDDLTEVVMSTSDECGNSSTTEAVIIVHTSANHFYHRQLFRRAYGDYNNTRPYRLKVVFLIGSSLDADLQIRLEQENRDFGDTVVGSFLDTYQNLTLKAVMGFRWLSTVCRDAKLVIKMDDDVIFDVRKFFSRYWLQIGNNMKTKSIHCLIWQNAPVGRTGKWKVERELFANHSYNFPYCAGFFAVISPDLIRPMYQLGKTLNFFWIDDVFLYGMVPAAIKGVHFFQLAKRRKFITRSYAELLSCRQKTGRDQCSIWAALTNNQSEFVFEYNTLLQPKPSFKTMNMTNSITMN